MTSEPDTAVGHGKPPVHSRFKKGQSGNPAGRPKRKRKSFDEEFNTSLKIALRMKYDRLYSAGASNCLNRVVQKLVLLAAEGDSQAMKYLLKRTEMADATAQQSATATDDAQKEPIKHGVSLTDEETQSVQQVTPVNGALASPETGSVTGSITGTETGNGTGGASGSDAGMEADEPPPVPPRPKRPTIMIGGEIVQQGD